MAIEIFVNLPVKDLKRSVAFFTQLGFQFKADFSDEKMASMFVSEGSFFLLLAEDFFRSFLPREISDTGKGNEVIVSLALESREKVDEMMEKAAAGGATTFMATKVYGNIYQRSFQDLDGHVWDVFFMDASM